MVPSTRAVSFVLAQRAGLDDEECKRIAFKLLETDLLLSDKENLLAARSQVESLELQSKTFDELMAIATRGSSSSNREGHVDAFCDVLQIMEKSQVVTPNGLALLRTCLGDRVSSLRMPRDRFGGIRPGRSLELNELRFAAPGGSEKLVRQALQTARALDPKAKDAIPSVESMVSRLERMAPDALTGFLRELQATLASLQAEPQPQEPSGENPVSDPPAPR